MRLVPFVVLVVACGRIDFTPLPPDAPATDPDDGNQSGTRLKIVWNQFEDGTRLYNGIYDSLRGERCNFLQWLDGNMYCTPDFADTDYTDATCNTPIGASTSGLCTMPAYDLDVDSCGIPVRMFELGATSSTTTYYRRLINQCNGPFTASAPATLVDLGSEVPATELAQATITSSPAGGRFATSYYNSADGLRLQMSLRDTVLDADCTPRNDGLCQPLSYETSYLASDAQCTMSVAVGFVGCTAPSFTESNIAAGDHYYRTGTPSTPSSLWVWTTSTASCTSVGQVPGENYYDVGAGVTLAPVSESVDVTPGHRIQLVHYTDGFARFAASYAYDTQLGVRCGALAATDGTLRCIPTDPSSGGIVGAFTDAGCTSPIDIVETFLGQPQAYAYKDLGTSCSPAYEVRAVGTLITTPIFIQNGTCSPLPVDYVANAVGAIVDPSMLSAVTVLTDP